MSDLILFNEPWLFLIYILLVLLLIFSLTKGKTYVGPIISLALISLFVFLEFIYGATLQEVLIELLILGITILCIINRRIENP